MLRDLTNAVGDLSDGRLHCYLGLAVLLGIGVFVGVWFGVDALLHWLGDANGSPWLLDWLGALTTVVLAWLLFPVVTSAILCVFLGNVAAIVEQRHWPSLPRPRGASWHAGLAHDLRFIALVVVVNVLLLGLLTVPPLYPIGWTLANGWLLGAEYFDVVALRWLEPAAATAMRRRHRGEVLLLGIGFALLFTLPVINIVVPVWATAVMVHRFHHWRATGS